MTEYATLDDLMVSEGPETQDVELSNGKTVKVRGLSRYEYLLAVKAATSDGGVDAGMLERQYLRFGMVEPKVDLNTAEKWQRSATAKFFEPISEAIRRLSGLAEGADKSEVSEV